MKELHSESEDQDLEFTQDVTGSHIPDTEEVPVDTAKIQAADASAKNPVSGKTLQDEAAWESGKPARKKRRTSRSLRERWWTPSVRSWFYTFMCMNMPIVGWFYLFHKARYEEDPARKEFARACLFYKLVFLIAGAVVLLILIWIGLGLLDQLLAYMEML